MSDQQPQDSNARINTRSSRVQPPRVNQRSTSTAEPAPAAPEATNPPDSESTPSSLTIDEQIAQLQAQLEQLIRQKAASGTSQPPSTSESPPIIPRFHLTERTPKIATLTDGIDPTFKQWQASIKDRLDINADHYPSERARMALVWGHTAGMAKDYLESGYLSESDQNRFKNAEGMIQLLRTYYITGNEEVEARQAFQALRMNPDETFPAFKARFISAATKGSVSQSEWSFYLWDKLLPSLQVPNQGFKYTWANSFEAMVAHLTAYDSESRRYRKT